MERTFEELLEQIIIRLPRDFKISNQVVEVISHALADIVYEDALHDTEFCATTISLLFDKGKQRFLDRELN